MPAATLLALMTVACGCGAPAGGPDEDALTLYCGRNERLIGPLLDRFTEATGIRVEARYGGTSELAATLMEEGERTPADVLISQDAAALGAVSRRGLLRVLPDGILERVPPRFRSGRRDWVGLSGRARVVVYNTNRITPEDLPQKLEQITESRYRGRFGIAPTNASAQAHLALYHALNGEQALVELLEGIVRNEPQRFPKNSPIVEAVVAGEIDWGLVNHYYLWRALEENPQAPARIFFMPGGDASSFINMAGAGLLSEDPRGVELLRFLLDDAGQRYFAEETYEYPLAPGIDPAAGLPPLEGLRTPQVDYADVAASLERTLQLIEESGLTRF